MFDKKLDEFLEAGSILRTKLNNCTKWVTNIVQSINNDFIEIDLGLEKDYVDNLIMIGDTLKCKYDKGDSEYNLIGWITNISLDFPQTITIRVHQVDFYNNVRDSVRYDVYLSSILKSDADSDINVFGVLTNISASGAAFIVKDELEASFKLNDSYLSLEKIHISVYISADKQLCSDCVLLRKSVKEKGFEYGIRFINMSSDDCRILNDFINELANKDKEIYNKRSSYWSKNSKL